ncbi:endoplasmic reticulum-Golgi intermediate compartment protein 3 isoform X2 [Chelonus insularis]|uniref:endoplasmic reticulum-Golgi intermediate compartment protein 3 isoform X2 n=1 Tax=Chelonus insularis TaxID=460826 RepID=UPI00158E3688|nr:endoplasmic reticulum-Golgi intermediate compartment protein 3 isoform X2 [Chelonus insularis]
MNITAMLRKFDAYPKTLEDFRVKTFSGALVTIVSSIIMFSLFMSELKDYLTPSLDEELFVDTSRGSKLKINLDIIVPNIACDLLSLDAMDTTGEQHLQIDHNIYKRRLNLDGQPIEDPKKTDILDNQTVKKLANQTVTTTTEVICGSCYGAEDVELNITCCNTCTDVKQAYILKKWAFPDPSSIKQCAHSALHEINNAFTEGCQIYGYMEVNRVGGSFHISPGNSFSINHVHVHDVQPYASSQFNMTHKIRHLSFGVNIPGKTNPMDNTTVIAEEGAMMFQHYIKIVPTTYFRSDNAQLQTNQFSITRHSKKIMAFGGESVAGFIDTLLYHSVRAIQKKQELGKFS